MGRCTRGVHIWRDAASLNRRPEPSGSAPRASWIAIQRAMSLALAATPPAGAAFCAQLGIELGLPAVVERLLRAHAVHRAVAARVRPGAVRRPAAVDTVRGRRAHARGDEDVLAHEALPALAADLFDELAGDDVEHVVVGIGAAEARRGTDVAKAPHRLGAAQRRARHEHQVAGAEAQPAAMHEEIDYRHLARDPGVVHLEPGDVLGHRVVPRDLAAIHEHGQGGGRERLPDGAELEDRVRVDGRRRRPAAVCRSRAPGSPCRCSTIVTARPGTPTAVRICSTRASKPVGRVGPRRAGQTPGRGRERGRSRHPLSTHLAGRYEPQNLVDTDSPIVRGRIRPRPSAPLGRGPASPMLT